MRLFFAILLALASLAVRGAVPTFQSFEPTQFETNNNRIAYKSAWTNDAGIVYEALPNSLTLVTNINAYGTFSMPTKVTLLVLGTNYLDMSVDTSWLLNSPTNDSSQVILSLSAGAYQGQFAYINSQNGGNGFTLPDMSEQYDVPGAYVDINGDWIGVTNRGMILRYVAPDWVEMARFDPSQTGGGTVLGSGTVPYLPYWLGPTTLASSPIQRVGANAVSIDGVGNSSVVVGNGLVLSQRSNIGSSVPTTLYGFIANNPFVATPSLQQNSPTVTWAGQGWGTNTATSQSVTFGSYVIPSPGADRPSGSLNFYSAISNGVSPSLVFSISNVSGYTGAGTLFLSDDGTYKSAGGGGSALWSSAGGVLQPSPAVDVVNITSQLADHATNVALVVQSDVPWAALGAELVRVLSGTNEVLSIDTYGSISIGHVLDFWGYPPGIDGPAFLSVHDVDKGDRPNNEMDVITTWVVPGSGGFSMKSQVEAYCGTNNSHLDVVYTWPGTQSLYQYTTLLDNEASLKLMRFGSGDSSYKGMFIDILSSGAVYKLGTPLTHSSGNIVEVSNNETNIATVDFLGRLSIQGKTNLIGDSGTALTYNGVAIGGGGGTNDIFLATKSFRSFQGSLTHAGTVTLDFDGTTTVNALTLTGSVTFATSNLATNRTYRLKITGTSTNAVPTFPAWKFLGGAPTTITASKVGMLSLEAWGTADTDVVAAYAEAQ